ASPRTTSSRTGLFRKDNRRVPKWYSRAPKRSGLTDTHSSSRHAPSRSNEPATAAPAPLPLGKPSPEADSVDTAHAVDGDLLHEEVLEQRLVGLVVPRVVRRRGGVGLDRGVVHQDV